MAQYKLKVGKMGQAAVNTHKKIENAVVGTYKNIENGVVGTYKKIENAFVDKFLEKVEDDETNDTKNN